MIFCRIAGVFLLVGSGIFGARFMNRSAAERLWQVEAWLSLLRYTRMQVDCFALPMSEILRRADADVLRACGYEEKLCPESFEALWSGCVIRDGECAEWMRCFSLEFGKGYREEQRRGCEYYEALLEQKREALSADLPMRKKVHSALWVSGALAAVILFI